MKNLLFISFLLMSIVNCSKSSDTSIVEVDVSEGQTNWTKIAYHDTIETPRGNRDYSGGININDIAIRKVKVVLGGIYAEFEGASTIWESNDSGETWRLTWYGGCGAGSEIVDVSIPTDNVIYALGNGLSNSRLFKSVDGEWSIIYTDLPAYYSSSSRYFFDENNGIVGNHKTIDAGESWNKIEGLEIPSVYRQSGSFSFVNTKTGYCATSGFEISSTNERLYKSIAYKTTDGGDNWTKLYESSENFRNIEFISEAVGFLSTDQGLLKTEDAGLTWRTVLTGATRSISFANNTTGFVTGPEGGLYKTSDTGETWQLNYTTEIFSPRVVKFDGEGLGILVGLQKDLSKLPNGKAYIAKTTTLGE